MNGIMRVKKTEWWLLFIMIAIYLYFMGLHLFMFVANVLYQCKYFDQDTHQTVLWSTSNVIQYVLGLSYFGVILGFILGKVLIYRVLIPTLKNNLNFYYTQRKKNLKILLMLAISSMVLLLGHIVWSYFYDSITFPNISKPNSRVTAALSIISDIIYIISHSVRFSYAAYTIKNIDFKIYLSMLMHGHQIRIPIDKMSRFIKSIPSQPNRRLNRNRWYVSR